MANQEMLIDLVYSIKTLAQSLDRVHEDLRQRTGALEHDVERIEDLVSDIRGKLDEIRVNILSRDEEIGNDCIQVRLGLGTVKNVSAKALWLLLTGGGSVVVYEFVRFIANRLTIL